MLLTCVSEKQRTNILIDRSGMAPKSAFWFGSSTYRLHRYRCHIGTEFRYPTLFKYLTSKHKIYLLEIQNGHHIKWCEFVFKTRTNTFQCGMKISFSFELSWFIWPCRQICFYFNHKLASFWSVSQKTRLFVIFCFSVI